MLVLHGAGVDHREAEACFEPLFDDRAGLRRIYVDLPGMGRTAAPENLCSADDVLEALLNFAEEATGGKAHLLIGHSAGAYYAPAMAAKRPALVVGLALVCPLLPGLRDVPEHRRIAGSGEIGDDVSRSYFVIQTPEMLERYLRYVAQPRSLSTRQRLIESVNTGSSAPFTPRLTRVQRWSWPDGSTPRLGMWLFLVPVGVGGAPRWG